MPQMNVISLEEEDQTKEDELNVKRSPKAVTSSTKRTKQGDEKEQISQSTTEGNHAGGEHMEDGEDRKLAGIVKEDGSCKYDQPQSGEGEDDAMAPRPEHAISWWMGEMPGVDGDCGDVEDGLVYTGYRGGQFGRENLSASVGSLKGLLKSEEPAQVATEQDLFSAWARGLDHDDPFLHASEVEHKQRSTERATGKDTQDCLDPNKNNWIFPGQQIQKKRFPEPPPTKVQQQPIPADVGRTVTGTTTPPDDDSESGSSCGSCSTSSSHEARLADCRSQVKEVMGKVNPEELENLGAIMDQVKGRETNLQKMLNRLSAQRATRVAVHKTSAKASPTQLGGYSNASEGFAEIAAASTLGPEFKRRQPRVRRKLESALQAQAARANLRAAAASLKDDGEGPLAEEELRVWPQDMPKPRSTATVFANPPEADQPQPEPPKLVKPWHQPRQLKRPDPAAWEDIKGSASSVPCPIDPPKCGRRSLEESQDAARAILRRDANTATDGGRKARVVEPREFVPTINAHDVISNKQSLHHAGNLRYREALKHSIDDYKGAGSEDEKMGIVERVIARIKEKGGRFLRHERGWQLLDDGAVQMVVLQSLRDAVKLRGEQSAAVDQSTDDNESAADWKVPGFENAVVDRALRKYETFHGLPSGGATVADLKASSAGIGGWASSSLGDASCEYETFHGLPSGGVTVADLRASSAGIGGWASSSLGDASCAVTIVQDNAKGGSHSATGGSTEQPNSEELGYGSGCGGTGCGGLQDPSLPVAQLDDVVVEVALYNYECFYGLKPGTATIEIVEATSAGIEGWASSVLSEEQQPKSFEGEVVDGKANESTASVAGEEQGHRRRKGDDEEARLLQIALLESVGVRPNIPHPHDDVMGYYSSDSDSDNDSDRGDNIKRNEEGEDENGYEGAYSSSALAPREIPAEVLSQSKMPSEQEEAAGPNDVASIGGTNEESNPALIAESRPGDDDCLKGTGDFETIRENARCLLAACSEEPVEFSIVESLLQCCRFDQIEIQTFLASNNPQLDLMELLTLNEFVLDAIKGGETAIEAPKHPLSAELLFGVKDTQIKEMPHRLDSVRLDLSSIGEAVLARVKERKERIAKPGNCMKVRDACPRPCCQHLRTKEKEQHQKVVIKKVIRRRREKQKDADLNATTPDEKPALDPDTPAQPVQQQQASAQVAAQREASRQQYQQAAVKLRRAPRLSALVRAQAAAPKPPKLDPTARAKAAKKAEDARKASEISQFRAAAAEAAKTTEEATKAAELRIAVAETTRQEQGKNMVEDAAEAAELSEFSAAVAEATPQEQENMKAVNSNSKQENACSETKLSCAVEEFQPSSTQSGQVVPNAASDESSGNEEDGSWSEVSVGGNVSDGVPSNNNSNSDWQHTDAERSDSDWSEVFSGEAQD